ncbi:MAG: 2-C-methyl-D-erythritol 4-phosphate cytidylyltransferase, partial [Butyrivibrio sp.]|nr:2-C-methyl-D-erythritol 4-phosphate cytidylyltransferase [Butyrivibrio sp.]
MMRGVAVVVAGGAGSRMRVTEGGVKKQYLDLGGKPLMYYALAALEQSALIDAIVVVVTPGDEGYVRTEIAERFRLSKVRAVVA